MDTATMIVLIVWAFLCVGCVELSYRAQRKHAKQKVKSGPKLVPWKNTTAKIVLGIACVLLLNPVFAIAVSLLAGVLLAAFDYGHF